MFQSAFESNEFKIKRIARILMYLLIDTLQDVEIPSRSPQLSISVDLDCENDNGNSNVKLLQANITKLVKEKDLDSIKNFGGIRRIIEALGTDLKIGIPNLEQDLCSQCMPSTVFLAPAPAQGFFKFLLKTCNNWIIFLQFVYAMLLLSFGIVMESPVGWHEGVITILFIIMFVLIHSFREFWLERSQKMSRKKKPLEMQQMQVDVVRGGCLWKVSISDVLCGDIVCLKMGSLVPADGLLISGEFLELDDGLDCVIDDKNPFLFYGPKVINGKGQMLVTSVGTNTVLGELLNLQVTNGILGKTPLPAQLDKLNTGTQIAGLLLSIQNLVVLFFRFKLQKKSFHFNLPDLKGKQIASKEIMDESKKIVLKPNGKISTLTASLFTSLLGVTEGIPFVIALAIGYWNKKMLSGKAIAREPLACLTMSSITTICIDITGWLTLNPMAVDVNWGKTRKEIEAWLNAGVNIILVSEDTVSVLEDIAGKCGLLPTADRLILEGVDFRNYTNEDRMDKVDKIVLIGSSSSSDMHLLVQCLKKKGHIVAMVGVKTNVIPALKEANVGITISTCSSEMVRESSDIIIMDSNLSFLVSIFRCGSCIYDNIRKYMQLELTMNIAGLLITSITTMFCGYSPITAIQFFCAYFAVTLLGGLGLLTEPPIEKLMEKPPLEQTGQLITMDIWRNVVIQALYQVVVTVACQFIGEIVISISKEVSKTMVFNIFVLCQVCNLINARQVGKKNAFEHFHRNPLFLLAVGVILVLQVAFIEIAHILVDDARLSWIQWFVCLLIGMASWGILY